MFHKKEIPDFLNVWKYELGVYIGMWYSTMASSECKHESQLVWESESIKVIEKSCMGLYTKARSKLALNA